MKQVLHVHLLGYVKMVSIMFITFILAVCVLWDPTTLQQYYINNNNNDNNNKYALTVRDPLPILLIKTRY